MSTLRQISKHTDLAVSTVSEVLRGLPGYNEATRTKVLQAAEQLNYQPNHLARGLRQKRSGVIGLVFNSLNSVPITLAKFATIERLVRAKGYGVLIANHYDRPDPELGAIQQLLRSQVEGMVLFSQKNNNQKHIEKFLADGVKIVTIDSPFDIPIADVSVDRVLGAQLQVRHILGDCKRRRIAFVCRPPDSRRTSSVTAKLQGYEKGLAEFGQTMDDHLFIPHPYQEGHPYEHALNAAAQLLKHRGEYDAVILYSDMPALPIVSSFINAGVRIPDEVAIIGFDDLPYVAYLPVPLSTIRQPRDIGEHVVRRLMEMLEADKITDEMKRQEWHAPTLIVRQSTMSDASNTNPFVQVNQTPASPKEK